MTEQEDEVLAKARQLRAAGVPLAEIERYVASKRGAAQQAGPVEAPEPEAGYPERLATTMLSAAQVIPGMKALQAGAGALGSKFTDTPVSYRDAYEGLGEQTDKLGTGRNIAAKVVASPVTAPIFGLRAMAGLSPTAQGAVFGGADQLLSGDPDATVGGTAARTGAGIVGGAVAGKLIDEGVTVARAKAGPAIGRVVGKIAPKKPTPVLTKIPDRIAPADGVPATPADAVKQWKPRHRTKAQFAHFAEQMEQRAAAAAPDAPPPPDAEPLDLEALLSASIKHVNTGGKLSEAKDAVPKYAGRYVGALPRKPLELSPSERGEFDNALADDLGGFALRDAAAAREGMAGQRGAILSGVRGASALPNIPTRDGLLMRALLGQKPDNAYALARQGAPELRRLDAELGTKWPAILRAAGISSISP